MNSFCCSFFLFQINKTTSYPSFFSPLTLSLDLSQSSCYNICLGPNHLKQFVSLSESHPSFLSRARSPSSFFFLLRHCIETAGMHPPPHCLFILFLFLSLICLSCVTTSICLSLLAIVCDNNSVIRSSGKTLKWRLFSALTLVSLTLLVGLFIRNNISSAECKVSYKRKYLTECNTSCAVCLSGDTHVSKCACVPACCDSQHLQLCVFVCVCVHHRISASAGPRSRTNETKQRRTDLHYHPPAGRRSLSACSVTCWSSYN